MLRPAPKGRSVTLDSLASSTGSGKDASLRTIESGVEARSTTASTERSSVGFHSGEPNGSGEFHWPEPGSRCSGSPGCSRCSARAATSASR